MTIFSSKTFAFAIAATIIGAGAMASGEASAWPLKPGVSPMPGKFNGQPICGGCPGGLVGCNPNTYTPGGGNHWHHTNWGYGGGVGLSIAVGEPSRRRLLLRPPQGLHRRRRDHEASAGLRVNRSM